MDLKIWEMFFSKPLIAALSAMFSAQIFKMFIPLFSGKKIEFKKFTSYGDIPSAHTAFIVAVTVSIGFQDGWKLSLFALAAVVASILIYDIIKLRKVVELNMKMTQQLMKHRNIPLEKNIPQFKGHSILEVMAGGIWGIICVIIVYGKIFYES